MPDTPTALEAGGVNAVGRMLGLLGDEWSLLILQQSLMGAIRYGDFTARLPISHSVLSNRLRTLTAAGLLERSAGYQPSARAKSLWPVLLCIWDWESTWVAEHQSALPVMGHQGCGQPFAPVLRCSACRQVAGPDDVRLAPGPSGGWDRSVPQSATRRRAENHDPARQAGLFPETMAVLGNRWSAALVVAAFLGTARFTDFRSQLGIPPTLLAERLQRLCSIGVLTADRDDPAYLLTGKGRALFGVLVCAQQWAQRWFHAPEGPALLLTHRGCGAGFVAELACGTCGQRLRGARVDVSLPAAAGIP